MTDRELEQRIRAWYRSELDQQVAPLDLRASVVAIPSAETPRAFGVRRPHRLSLLAAAAILALTALIGALAVGSGLVHLNSVLPPASPDASTTEPADTAVASPAATAPGPLGGGLIILQEKGAVWPYEPPDGSSHVVAIDAGTGARTVLGAVPGLGSQKVTLQWTSDRSSVLLDGGRKRLESLTDAGRSLTFLCCEPDTVQWIAAPVGNHIAGGHDALITISGIEGRIGIQDGIVVANLDGSGVRTLRLPSGSAIPQLGPSVEEFGWSWSPDGSAVVVTGCSPCTYDDPFRARKLPAGVVARNHVWIVPVDGSPVRELLDETRTMFLSPAWSRDGSVVALQQVDCRSTGPAGICSSSEVLLHVRGGEMTTLPAGGGEAAWSPDGTRLAVTGGDQSPGGPGLFLMNADGTGSNKVADGAAEIHWSPDGQWLLFSRHPAFWIVPASGGEPRLIPGVSRWGGGLDW